MHTLFDKTIKHKHEEKKETYFANGIEASRHDCKKFLKLSTSNEGAISVEKQVSIELDQKKREYSFTLNLSCATLSLVKASGKMKYKQLIHLVFNLLDSALEFQSNIAFDNLKKFNHALSAYCDFINTYRLDHKSPMYKESLTMYRAITCDVFTYNLLAESLKYSVQGIEYLKKYGKKSIPQIKFPELPEKENHLLDIIDSKNFIDNILNNISSIQEEFSQDHVLPLAKAQALDALNKINLRAKTYSQIIEEYLTNPSVGIAPK